jgi:K+ transporter
VGISIAIIAALFLIQQFGTKFVGSLFSPIVMVWLFFNLGARIDGGSGPISSMRFAARA